MIERVGKEVSKRHYRVGGGDGNKDCRAVVGVVVDGTRKEKRGGVWLHRTPT